jgi:Kef-type K+ transport system membrane component KefB
MTVIIQIATSLAIALVLAELFHRMKHPRVLGQIFTGVLLSLPIFGFLFAKEAAESIGVLSDLGIIFLLLLAGLEVNLHKLEKTSSDSLLMSLFSVFIPFFLGFFAVILMAKYGILLIESVRLYVVAAVVGGAMAITAEGTTLNVLMEMNVLNTKLGTIMLGAGILDDLFEIIFLSLLLMAVHQTLVSLAFFPILIVGFIFIVFIIIKIVPRIIKTVQREHSRIATVSTMIVITLIIAGLSQLFGLSPIIGAFLAGIIIQWANKDRYDEQQDVKELKVIAFSLIVPFFFINIGLHLDLHSLWTNPLLFLVILAVGVGGKLLGALLVTPLTDLSLKQSMLVGWGMNSRGAVELVIAEIARVNNLISTELYSAIVAMAVITTIIFPFVLRHKLNKDPSIMN